MKRAGVRYRFVIDMSPLKLDTSSEGEPSLSRQHISGLPLQEQVCAFFTDHDGRCIDVAAHEMRHDGGVDDAQALDPMHLECRVDDGRRVNAHLAGAAWVE